ncbi:formimidoylglutamate deiminase [Pseudooceanicola sp. 216_PA32_1]|uniref:Formimidoylglutamate deiminase n=1 Tax=Pseudooceanicola pacificus TaxID=2676438 RepID=A0A844W4B8_9RHOB|nr:formimidoylglutamate deiminase [Pseudooceanicola pacificus]MWB77554.1 formimidoylglutamate deiminase [Pseudooceanicola pacificus]
MQMIHAGQALLPDGWARDVAVMVEGGRIASARPGSTAEPGAQRVDVLLPAPSNLHSHAFQRAMAGLTEARGPDPADSFWTWRRLMFRFLDRLDPEQVQAIAAFVQMEMLEAGYGASVEFHYLHHQPGGVPYDDLAEMSARIAAGADISGIGLTLLPVLYRQGGCDGRALAPGQVRFGCDPDLYARLVAGAGAALKALPDDARLGLAPHSLRAVPPQALAEVTGLGIDGPIHMHLAEQMPEVQEVRAALGARPVEWALENIDLGPRWCLIHCTQMTPGETRALAATGAVAGLCPITESNLGDGIFDGTGFLGSGGRIGLGSDSNLRISLTEEIRVLEHSQRLRDRGRAMLAAPGRSTARRLLDEVLTGGAQAAGRDCGRIAPGALADLLALDTGGPDLEGLEGDRLLDVHVFAGDDRAVAEVWSAGRHVVTGGRHIRHDEIVAGYRRALAGLREAL